MIASEYKLVSSFRKDIVSGGWVLVAAGRRNRPGGEKIEGEKRKIAPIEDCPFEDPQKGNETAVLWYARPGGGTSEDMEDWFLQVIPNKFPVLNPHNVCPVKNTIGPFEVMDGIGMHEVIITRDHEKSIADFSGAEIELVLRSYTERIVSLKKEDCLEYVLVFHNYGLKAGASVFHPHSQLIALPIIPPDVSRSLEGARSYFEKNGRCVHCAILKYELSEKSRVIYEDDYYVAICPFASHVSFEIRIYPRKHSASFENTEKESRKKLAASLKEILHKLKLVMNDPDYNFFIHTAPIRANNIDYYHWHIEILPRTSIWAGVELGTGIEVIVVSPEEAAEKLRDA